MANSPDDAPLVSEHQAGSQETLIAQAAPSGSSNSRALKIAGLTTLACLLLASQVLTAYMVFDQRQQIRGLQKTSEKLSRDVVRSSRVEVPMAIQKPMTSLVLDFSLNQDAVTTKHPETRHEDASDSQIEKQPTDNAQDLDVARANPSPTRTQMNQPDIPVTKTRCQIEASAETRPGSFKPSCDEHGRYSRMQCWHAIGFCWCVDETGAAIGDTASRGRVQCGEY